MELFCERLAGLAEADAFPVGDDRFNPTIRPLNIA
jgi:hypothetical protein